MRIIGLLLIIITTTFQPIHANYSDSLKNIVNSKNSSPEEISDVCLKLGLNYLYSDYNQDSCRKYAHIGLEAGKKADYAQGKLKNLIVLGISEINLENYTVADSLLLVAHNTKGIDKNTIEYTNLLIQLGIVKEMISDYAGALKYYFEGIEICEIRKDSSNMASLNNNIGIIYDLLDEVGKSIEYARKASVYFKKNGNAYNYSNTLLNIALLFQKTNNLDSLNYYIPFALSESRKASNYIAVSSLIMIKGNIEFENENFEKAQQYYNAALEAVDSLSSEFKKNEQLGNCYFHLAQVLFQNGKIDEAIVDFNKSLEFNTIAENKSGLKDCYKYLGECAEIQHQNKNALDYYKKYYLLDSELSKEKNSKGIARIEYGYELQKQEQIQKLEELRLNTKIRNLRITTISVSVLLLMGLILIYLIYKNRKSKISKAKLVEKNLALKLENKEKEVTTNVLYLLKKNEFLANLTDTLQELNNQILPENKSYMRKIINDIERNTFKDSWEEFEKRFQEVHVDFYKNLLAQFPDLTPNELKICAFLKLNMTSKDISAITNQSVDTLKVARFRLRKKLGLDKGENMIAFFAKL
jgi:tetratricopeptide (TPR) repeat protein